MTLDPRIDKFEKIVLPISGRTVEIITPGKGPEARASQNWRLCFAAFTRYEPLLRQIADNWPKETTFAIPSGMSPNTFVSRFRDARQALLLYRDYDALLHDRFKELTGKLVISLTSDSTHVIARAAGSAGRKAKTPDSQGQAYGMTAPSTSSITALPSDLELRAIVLLISTGRLSGPLQFRGQVADDIRVELETNYDIAFQWDLDTGITTLL